MRLAGKVALITGATSGIGKQAAILFAKEGAKVVFGGRRTEEGRAVEAEIRAAGGDGTFVTLDVSEPESAENAVRTAITRYGKLDVLFNNAGGSSPADGSVITAELEEFWRVIKLDLFGTFLCSRFAIPEIIKAGGGAVINHASMVAEIGVPNTDCYTCAKGGVTALTRSMSVEFVQQRVRVNAIASASVLTERIEARIKQDPRVQDALKVQPLGHIQPREIAETALYLASDAARSVTGQVLRVTGGRT